MRQWLAGVVVGAVVGGLTAAGVVLLIGAPVTRAAPAGQVQQLVRAQGFELVDRNGVVRATLGVNDLGTTLLALNDEDGARRLEGLARRGWTTLDLGKLPAPTTSAILLMVTDEVVEAKPWSSISLLSGDAHVMMGANYGPAFLPEDGPAPPLRPNAYLEMQYDTTDDRDPILWLGRGIQIENGAALRGEDSPFVVWRAP